MKDMAAVKSSTAENSAVMDLAVSLGLSQGAGSNEPGADVCPTPAVLHLHRNTHALTHTYARSPFQSPPSSSRPLSI